MRTKATITAIALVMGISMSALAQNWFPSSGNAGVGTTTPTDLLEVSGGDIHISTANRAYRLYQSNILWHNGKLKSIFVGVDAGNSTVTADGNTMVGAESGQALSTGSYNTALGFASGTALTTGGFNTFAGESAGFLNTSGNDNVFFGRSAGYTNVSGSSITALGSFAGLLTPCLTTPSWALRPDAAAPRAPRTLSWAIWQAGTKVPPASPTRSWGSRQVWGRARFTVTTAITAAEPAGGIPPGS